MRSIRRVSRRAFFGRAAILASAAWLAACEPISIASNSGPSIDATAPVPVALLVPSGSANQGDAVLARSLENAARMAMADLGGVQIDLQVYSTAGTAAGASAAATQAANNGAKIILGPVYSEAANAAGLAVASRGINVLSFSNNTAIAGGNVFVLGQTFRNTADRLVSYSRRQGKRNIYVVNADSPSEVVGRDAIVQAISANGARVAGSSSFALSQQALTSAAPQIAANARNSGADAIFFTSTNDGAMPFLASLLPQNGLPPSAIQYLGLGRLDIPATALSQPGYQGSWFTLPDQSRNASYQSRYSAQFGASPHPIAGLAYDGIAAIGALVKSRGSSALTRGALTQGSGFVGVNGIFRLRNDGTNERGLAIAEIRNNQVVVIDSAPRSFGGAGF